MHTLNYRTILTPMPNNATVADLYEDLSPEDRAAIEDVRLLRIAKENAADAYAKAIRKATRRPAVSYGLLGYALGIRKEILWRQEKAWLERVSR